MRLISAGSLVRAQSGPAVAWSVVEREGSRAEVNEGGFDAPRLRLGRPAHFDFRFLIANFDGSARVSHAMQLRARTFGVSPKCPHESFRLLRILFFCEQSSRRSSSPILHR